MASSQSSFEETSTPIELPSTPQPHGINIPAKADIPRSNSPTTSLMVAGSSPILHSPSITPPPSSQPPNLRHLQVNRSSTPNPSALSSPPPTIPNGMKKHEGRFSARPSTEQLANASEADLRGMLEKVMAENVALDAIASEARMSAAHYKLQHNLLTIESEEALKRMEVEHELTRREVQVLQFNGRDSTHIEYTQKLKAYCKDLTEQNITLTRRLDKAKRIIEDKDDQLMDSREEVSRLHERIRQNREHINLLRSPGGPLHPTTPKATPATPRYHGTPKYTPTTNRPMRYPASQDNQERFNALLLAGSVLSQENNSAPSTPTVGRRPDPRTPNKHNRGVQSLSSFPTTPGSGRQLTGNSTLLPSAQFSPQAEARVVQNLHQNVRHAHERRRKSRDSTISASDHEEIARINASFRSDRSSEEVPESQASQSATEMLRADPREAYHVAASRNGTPVPNDKFSLQHGTIYGSITKLSNEKRKLDDDYTESRSPAKKMRGGETEAIGLGIGFDTRA